MVKRSGKISERLVWNFLSIPISIKILGIILLVTTLFGTVAFFQIRKGMFKTHYEVHAATALSVATSLASRIEPFVTSKDLPALDRNLDQTMQTFPDVRYIVVQAPDGRILSHGFTFPQEAPPDLLERGGNLCAGCHQPLAPTEIPRNLIEIKPTFDFSKERIRAYIRSGGMILEAMVPVGDAEFAAVRLGIGDTVIVKEMSSITRSLLWSLAFCLIVSLTLSMGLSFALVRPIHNLVQSANRLRQGDFMARAKVYSDDEIGRLAEAFNDLAQGLDGYKCEVQEREADRVSLLGKIVQAQEEERKNVARELHDQLGQSLSNTLLTVKSAAKDAPELQPILDKIASEIHDLIDDVRRLAWQVRPSILDDYGLDRALYRYLQEMSKRAGFPMDYQCVGLEAGARLPAPIEVTLYRIAQEAIVNIVRHAEANRASVVLMVHVNEASLIIEDNGKGFDPVAVEKAARGESERRSPLGLIGMKERTTLVGGVFTIDSRPGAGVSIRVKIPVLNQAEEGKAHNGH